MQGYFWVDIIWVNVSGQLTIFRKLKPFEVNILPFGI